MKIISDKDLWNIDVRLAADAILRFLLQSDTGADNAPPRTVVTLDNDALAITAGAGPNEFGFRAYTYRAGLERDHEDQIVACWDRKTHRLKALAVGERLGAWRTGILGGIAFDTLKQQEIETCCVIGTGLQAFTQVRAIAALARPERFLVFSRNEERRAAFALKLEEDTGIRAISSARIEALVRAADALVVATSASEPVFDIAWLERCKHISTIGPKSKHRHETPVDVAIWADQIVSDSPQQIAQQGGDHFLADVLSLDQIDDLGTALRSDHTVNADRRTLYLSAGLAGTEVALLDALAGGLARPLDIFAASARSD
jgi:ornithine cyclodeaminase